MYVHLGKTKRHSLFSKNNEINEKLQKTEYILFLFPFFFFFFGSYGILKLPISSSE